MKKNLIVIIVGVVTLLIGGGAGFFAGMKYQQGKTPQRGQFLGMNNFGGNGNGGNRRFGNGNGMAIRGQIISSDSNSITVKLQDGSTKIVILNGSSVIAKSTTGQVSDLTNGSEVTAFGTTNSDGSITAQNIQIGAGLFGQRMGQPSPSASPAPQGY